MSIETRSIDLREMRTITIFSSNYRTKHAFRLSVDGDMPPSTWTLDIEERSRAVTRRLGGDSLPSLAELYGPLGQLRFMGAWIDGSLAGLLTWRYDSWNRAVWLCDIRVRSEFRRRGVGARLVEDLTWAAMRENARGIMLETQTMNYPAVRFYLGRAFRLVGFNTALYRNPETPAAGDIALFFWRSLGD